MQFNYTKYSFVLIFLLGVFFVYKIFFSNNMIDGHRHLHHQAHMALHDEKYEQVIEICDQAIQSDASPVNQYLMLVKKAKALNKLHRYEEAINSAEDAVAIYPKKEEAYLVQVDALFNLGMDEELTAVLEEIMAINPRTPLKPLLNSLRVERGKAQY